MESLQDKIYNKQFKEAANGLDRTDVDDFLNELMDDLDARDEEVKKIRDERDALQAQVTSLQNQLSQAQTELAKPRQAEIVKEAPRTESYEYFLDKARKLYDDTSKEAQRKYDEIIAKANSEAAQIRENAQNQVTDLSDKLAGLRSDAKTYYNTMKKMLDEQSVSVESIRSLL